MRRPVRVIPAAFGVFPAALGEIPPRGLTLKTLLRQRGTNVLFADGHVDALSPFEAYNATMGGGLDILAP